MYKHIIPLNFYDNFFWGAMPEKGLKIGLSFKIWKLKTSFLNIKKCFFFLNELHTSFLAYFDTQHLICEILFFFVPGGPKFFF